MKTLEGKCEVQAIENGTVLDHLPPESLFKVLNIMRLESDPNRMTIGNNLPSKQMGTKAIIKINDRFLKPEEINRIAIVAPNACVNHIRNFEVVEKQEVSLPERIEGFVRCANPNCVTNKESVSTSFRVEMRGDELLLHCKYCEKTTHQNSIQIIQ